MIMFPEAMMTASEAVTFMKQTGRCVHCKTYMQYYYFRLCKNDTIILLKGVNDITAEFYRGYSFQRFVTLWNTWEMEEYLL